MVCTSHFFRYVPNLANQPRIHEHVKCSLHLEIVEASITSFEDNKSGCFVSYLLLIILQLSSHKIQLPSLTRNLRDDPLVSQSYSAFEWHQ